MLPQQETCDEVPADDEKDIDSDEPTNWVPEEVICDYENHSQGS